MLYSIGALTLDTRPFSVDEMQRTRSVDFAEKPLIGAMPSREFVGEAAGKMTLSGQLLPFKTGGLTELELANSMMLAGRPLPVLRGDGARIGWFTIDKISEGHKELMRDGVGFFIRHSIELTKDRPDSSSPAVIGTILSLFGLLE
ncbi:phage tail protein [Rhizobium sp. RU36D]|uniref:phage tail protein n=1 Tax=Rhizobium sp. RU36D TaxID=1907415 RepID=UPI0009D80FD4|nr:phage tail protein [Rhizobium sp. RU36D]SMD18063.1 hypothetical protein SAMN05880593_13410 [Rhizobium sp. RU36D]